MRDHRKLRALELADRLALLVYKSTKSFPDDERFGLTAQMRRAAISIASNIVEGCARETQPDYVRFLGLAYASSCELHYQVSLAKRLEYLADGGAAELDAAASETSRVPSALIQSLRQAT
jgi:four helix bundle protein